MSLFPIVDWIDNAWLSRALQKSHVASPIIEAIHLIGLTILLSTIFVTDLFLLGVFRRQPASRVAQGLAPWTLSGLLILVVSGSLLWTRDVKRLYERPPLLGINVFAIKMILLSLAVLFYFTVHRRITQPDSVALIGTKLGALLSLALWFAVAFAGQAVVLL